jgi:hypothetical protein
MDYITHHPGYSIYMGKIWVVDAERHVLDKNEVPFAHAVYTHDILLNRNAMVVHQGTFYNRHVFEQAGGYSERLRYHMDYEFHLRASKDFEILTMEFPIATLRTHAGAKTQDRSPDHAIELFWARRVNGGKLLHRHNLFFLKIYLASHSYTRKLYEVLKKVTLFQRFANRTGWNRLNLR